MGKTIKYPKITLDVRGRLVQVVSKVNSSVQNAFDWGNAVLDAGIVAGLTFFSTYAATSTVGIPQIDALKSAAIASGTQFFLFLAIKRGVVKQNNNA